jgi:hypothetical protein
MEDEIKSQSNKSLNCALYCSSLFPRDRLAVHNFSAAKVSTHCIEISLNSSMMTSSFVRGSRWRTFFKPSSTFIKNSWMQKSNPQWITFYKMLECNVFANSRQKQYQKVPLWQMHSFSKLKNSNSYLHTSL